MTPAERLCRAFKGLTRDEIIALATKEGIGRRIALYAALGRPVALEPYLKFAGRLGMDPMTGCPRKQLIVGDFNWQLFGSGMSIRRQLAGQSQRAAAKGADLSAATWQRIEKGTPRSVDSVLKICKFLGTHPYQYCAISVFKANVSRGTSLETAAE